MNILRLSTLSLFLAIAVITFGVSADVWAKPKCDNPPCGRGGGGGEAGITHVAKLTGAFAFSTANNSVNVTANSKGTELRSADPVTLIRPGGADQALWDFVFAQCRFFLPTSVVVPRFTAPSDGKGWTIGKGGGIVVGFRKIPFDVADGPVEVNLLLIGTTAYEEDFLPVSPDTTITHTLSHFIIWGQTVKGGTPGSKCHSDSVTGGTTFLGGSVLALTITAIPPPSP